MNDISLFLSNLDFNLSIIESTAVILSIIYVVLATKQNIYCWTFAFISTTLYVYIFYNAQLFAETGIIGLIIGCIMFGSIIFTCYRAREKAINCPMSATAFVVPFAMFFPLQQFGSFYGQWGNLFMWFAILSTNLGDSDGIISILSSTLLDN